MPWSMFILVYVNIDEGKNKVAQNEKQKKNYLGFLMANFEAFRWNISSSINLLILKSEWSVTFCFLVNGWNDKFVES